MEQFFDRVKQTLMNTPVSYKNKAIESMNKRMSMIIEAGGKRIRY